MIWWIISLIIFSILISLLFRFTKGIVRTIITAFMLLFLLFSVLLVFAFLDAREFSQKFPTAKNGFILIDNEPKAIFLMDNGEVILPNNAETQKYFKRYDEGALNDFYKLFIIKKSAFSNVTLVNFQEENITAEFAWDVIYGDSTKKITEYIMEKEGIENSLFDFVGTQIAAQFGDSAKIKNTMFALLFQSANDKDQMFIVKEYKKANIEVIPRTSLFRLVSFIPYSWIETIIKVNLNE